MTAALLPSLAEIMIANPTEVREANILGIAAHGSERIRNIRHGIIVPLMILLSSAATHASEVVDLQC